MMSDDFMVPMCSGRDRLWKEWLNVIVRRTCGVCQCFLNDVQW